MKFSRIAVLTMAIAAPLMLAATPAHAATGRAYVAQSVVVYDASSGYSNDVVISRQGDSFLIDDRAPIPAGKGCSHPNKNDRTLVWCYAPNASRIEVYTWSRDDRVTSNAGIPSVLHGGVGNDRLYGSNRNDTMYGEAGNDVLFGQRGNDLMYGGPGNDKLNGWMGNDVLYGQDGNDFLRGENGDDHILGNSGNDTLDGGSGNNRLLGGGGADTCINGPDIPNC